MSTGKSLTGFNPAVLAKLHAKLSNMADKPAINDWFAQHFDKQADILVGEIRAALQSVIKGTEPDPHRGALDKSVRKELVDAVETTQVFVKAGGELTTTVSKAGVRFDHALAEEFGTAREAARPFFYNTCRAAIPRIVASVVFDMSKTLKEPEAVFEAHKEGFTGFDYQDESVFTNFDDDA